MQVQKSKSGFKQIKWHYKKIIEIPESWDVEKLGKLCTLRENAKITSNLYIGLEHISPGSNTLEGKGDTSEFSSTKNEFYEGDVLYGKLRPLLNKVWLATESGYCSTDILPIVASKKILNQILSWILSNHYFFSYAVGTSAGTKMPRTNWTDIKRFILFLPSLPEQQKIASIITHLDELILSCENSIEYTKKLKKGLAQQILSKGIGNKKFRKINWLFGKEIEIPEGWEIKKINDIFEFLSSGTNPRSDLNQNGEIHYIHYGDIHTKWNLILNCDSEKITRIDKSKVSKLPLLKDGDLIIADVSEDYEGSGTSILLKNVNDKKIVSGLHTFALRSKDKNISTDFIKYLTSIHSVKIQIISYVTGAKVFGLSKNSLKNIKVPLPPLLEQQKIASVLTDIDSSILNLEDEKRNLKLLKKGLLQKLLLGQIRVG